MSDYQSLSVATLERFFTVVARADGSPIVSGTVNYYLKATSGSQAGKWWRNSDQTWQAAETANALSHDADGHWGIVLSGTPFEDGVRYLEYVKETGNLHVPDARHVIGRYLAAVDATNRVKSDAVAISGDSVAADNLEAAADGTGFNLGGGQVVAASVTAGVSLAGGERTAIANEVESQIIDDADSERVLQAIVDKIAAANPSLDDLTLGGIASAVRSELSIELGRIDATISSRLAASAYSGSGSGSVVQVLPLVTSVQTEPVRSTPLVAYELGEITHRVAVFDAQGAAIDLSGKSLQFTLESLSGAEIGFSNAVNVQGTDQNTVVVAAPAEWHGTPGLYRYAVRDVADGNRVWVQGEYRIERAAGPHG